jgi:hypothetical protein
VAVLLAFEFSLVYTIARVKQTGGFERCFLAIRRGVRFLDGRRCHLFLSLKGFLVQRLGGYNPVLVNLLIARTTLLLKQKESLPSTSPIVQGQIRFLKETICNLDPSYETTFYPKSRVSRMETGAHSTPLG